MQLVTPQANPTWLLRESCINLNQRASESGNNRDGKSSTTPGTMTSLLADPMLKRRQPFQKVSRARIKNAKNDKFVGRDTLGLGRKLYGYSCRITNMGCELNHGNPFWVRSLVIRRPVARRNGLCGRFFSIQEKKKRLTKWPSSRHLLIFVDFATRKRARGGELKQGPSRSPSALPRFGACVGGPRRDGV